MAVVEPIKKGGRYTKKEQEERKLQVYQLHFEENKSAVEISEILNFNRNTINADIRFWYSQLASKSKLLDIKAKMMRQMHKMEIQRDRFLEYLDEAEKLNEKIKLEKLIFDMDKNLAQIITKWMIRYRNTSLNN